MSQLLDTWSRTSLSQLTLTMGMKYFLFGPGVLLLLFGVLFLWLARGTQSLLSVLVAIVLWLALALVYFSPLPSTWLGQTLLDEARQLEAQMQRENCQDIWPTIVVLGGGLKSEQRLADTTEERVQLAAELVAKNPRAPRTIIFSGGPTLTLSNATEAKLSAARFKDILHEKGIADAIVQLTIINEDQSLNTYENALQTKRILQERKLGDAIVLLTSAYHLPRSVRVFQKQVLRLCPIMAPAPQAAGVIGFKNAQITFAILNELIGELAYRFKGWI